MGFEYQKLASGEFQMPAGWEVTTIADVACINELAITKRTAPEHIEYIDIASVDKGRLMAVQELPFEKAPSRARRVVRSKDSLISTVRPNLEHYLFVKEAKPNTIASTGFAVVSAKSVDPRFLYYYLTSKPFTAYLTRIAESHTSAYPAFNPDVIENAELLLPTDPEQRTIAHILGSLDDKIELNRQMNRTLEKMAQAIFKSWFIDFDPVRAKAEGRDPGLPKEIADLFPDSFEDSELGPIPKGWKVRPIGEAVQCVGGSTPSTKNPKYWDGGTNPFVTPKDMSSLISPVILGTERHITDAGVEKISSRQLPVGTVLLSSRAPIGYLAITEIPVSVNQGIIAMICNGDLPNHYVLQWTRTNMDIIKSNAGGTTFAEISKRNFRPIPVVIPPLDLLDAFVDQVGPLHQQLVLNCLESRELTAIRDTLLPKLISGELRVPDAEKLVEGTV